MNSYVNLWHRLMGNIRVPENEQACWEWKSRHDNWQYPLVNIWVPGQQKTVTLKAHIVAWVLIEAECTCADEVRLAYLELVSSGMELDHTCVNPRCINPDHLELETPKRNCEL